jgi:16S rRNA (guanine(966)-N(2))-methyltransferase RsmD
MSFLDIFSGSGAIGIEAISRGSELVYFIDNDYEACRLIKYNLAKLSQGEGLGSVEANVLKKNFLDENLLLEKKFDIIFLDPPYDKFTSENVFQRLLEMDVIKKDTLIVFESDSNQAGIGGFNLIDIRNIGKTFISFFKVSY